MNKKVSNFLVQAQNSGTPPFRAYTTQDFINQVPCFFIYKDEVVSTKPMALSGARPDGTRLMTAKCGEDACITHEIEGTTHSFYARKD